MKFKGTGDFDRSIGCCRFIFDWVGDFLLAYGGS